MKNFTPEEEAKIESLVAKLRLLQEKFKPYGTGIANKTTHLPVELKEEVIKIYDENGGIEVLSEISDIPAHEIRSWHQGWKNDPEYFYNGKDRVGPQKIRGVRRVGFTRNVMSNRNELNHFPVEYRLNHKNVNLRREDYRSITTLDQVRHKLSAELQERCENVKELMKAKGTDYSDLDPEIKTEIVKIVLKAGHPKPVALLLGINERMIIS